MNAYEKFIDCREKNNSLLCVGLDTDVGKLPQGISKDISGIYEFNKKVIEATKDLVCAYKINFAFYEQYGTAGIEIMKKTFDLIPHGIFTIADAKRGDIGNTSSAYAKSVFEYFGADSVTLSPYMGSDSIQPFLEHKSKMAFLLALTSNKGSADFQRLQSGGEPFYKHVIKRSAQWAGKDNLGYVIGATHPGELVEIRNEIPDRVILIPGVGSQGGDTAAVLKANNSGPAMINVSRDIIYTSHEADFEVHIRERAQYYKDVFCGL